MRLLMLLMYRRERDAALNSEVADSVHVIGHRVRYVTPFRAARSRRRQPRSDHRGQGCAERARPGQRPFVRCWREMLERLGIQRSDWVTDGVSVAEEYEWRKDTNVLVGHRATTGVTVTVRRPRTDRAAAARGGRTAQAPGARHRLAGRCRQPCAPRVAGRSGARCRGAVPRRTSTALGLSLGCGRADQRVADRSHRRPRPTQRR